MKSPRQTWHFTGGPLDGLVLKLPIEVDIPSELVFREDEIAPGWDAVYRRRRMAMVELPFTGWTFDYTGDTEGRRNELWYRQQFKWRNEEIARLKARLKRQAGWISRYRGTIKAMKTHRLKARGGSSGTTRQK